MKSLFVLCIFSVLLVNIWAETRGPKWGDVGGIASFQERVAKRKIPLLTRSTTITYPEVATPADEKNTQLVGPPLLRGFEHVNLLNKEESGCDDPTVEVKDGGLYKSSVTIEITSARGCPLDSAIFFYATK